jgi:hypothetical protein
VQVETDTAFRSVGVGRVPKITLTQIAAYMPVVDPEDATKRKMQHAKLEQQGWRRVWGSDTYGDRISIWRRA